MSLDAVMGFIDDHYDVMSVLRDVIAAMVAEVVTRAEPAVHLLDLRVLEVPAQIPAIDFDGARQMIERDTGRQDIGEPDLAPADERWLVDWALREHRSEFVSVVGCPMGKRPFYTHPDPARPAFSNSFNLVFRGVELVTGGQRLHRYADYVSALAGQDLAPYDGYLEAFRHGMPPHGGLAIGLERWTGAANVREVTLFPRDLHRLTP